MSSHVSRAVHLAVAAAVLLGAGALLAHAFAGVDARATARAVLRMGPAAPLALFPWIAGMAMDAAGMRFVLVAMGRRVRHASLVLVRVATEALHMTAPAGFLVSDSMTASLLATREGVPLADGAVLAVGRKWLVTRAHAAYIVLGAALGAEALTAISRRDLGGAWLAWAIAASALVPLGLSLGLGLGFRGYGALVRIQSALAKVPNDSFRRRVAAWREHASAGDATLRRVGAARDLTWSATACFFCCWLFEAVDTVVILRLLGVPLDFGFAMGAEVAISLLRSAGNVLPAGLGVQDAGYAALLSAMGVAPDAAAAFVVVKRGKELVWIAGGYALLAVLRRLPSRTAASVAFGTFGAPAAPAVSSGVAGRRVEAVAHAPHAANEGRGVPELLA
ncbi:MAG TPA: lysylphosphatidylglycerol synthase domain-containing protein [Polyangiaceae bacterium]|nr:lysylphosphatidylglycerol synthase domain-containing protein [Polyangiaceae bacterium]